MSGTGPGGSRAPPPSHAPSADRVEASRRRFVAPRGPPPAGMTFNAPRQVGAPRDDSQGRQGWTDDRPMRTSSGTHWEDSHQRGGYDERNSRGAYGDRDWDDERRGSYGARDDGRRGGSSWEDERRGAGSWEDGRRGGSSWEDERRGGLSVRTSYNRNHDGDERYGQDVPNSAQSRGQRPGSSYSRGNYEGGRPDNVDVNRGSNLGTQWDDVRGSVDSTGRNFDQNERFHSNGQYYDPRNDNGPYLEEEAMEEAAPPSNTSSRLVVRKSIDQPDASAGPKNGSTNSAGNPSAAKATAEEAKGKGQAVLNFGPILQSTYRDLKNFVLNPCPPNVITRCYIERCNSSTSGGGGIASSLGLGGGAVFSLCADLDDGTGRELMVCRRIIQSRSAHYVFSLKAEDLYRRREQRSRLFLGKLRAVNAGEYVLYDNGYCAAPEEPAELADWIESGSVNGAAMKDDPRLADMLRKMEKDKADHNVADDVSLYRRELAVIRFNTRTRPAPKGIRGMEVCIPRHSVNGVTVGHGGRGASVSSTSEKAPPSLLCISKPFAKICATGMQNRTYTKSCLVLHERTSRYDPLSSCLVDFRGRAHIASVKNFQLVVSDPMAEYPRPVDSHEEMMRVDAEKEIVLQMGKTTADCFNMDFREPLSLLQAFAISIARFDHKLSW